MFPVINCNPVRSLSTLFLSNHAGRGTRGKQPKINLPQDHD